MTVQEAKHRLQFQLRNIYDEREAATITDWVMEHITGMSKVDRLIRKDDPLTPHQKMVIEKHLAELTSHKPVQYVLGEAWFRGMKFYVNENTLIPRPETEELVELLVQHEQQKTVRQHSCSILDIGTGSGCIPISIKKSLPWAQVSSCDISESALEVAQHNAKKLQQNIDFFILDFLDEEKWQNVSRFDCIVSNPPYIPLSDKETMDNNVVMYEPWQALFVENERPLIFYEAIARFATTHLLPGGSIYVETHESNADAVKNLFVESNLGNVEVHKDMQGKKRFVVANQKRNGETEKRRNR